MNRKYIDFVPTKGGQASKMKQPISQRPIRQPVSKTVKPVAPEMASVASVTYRETRVITDQSHNAKYVSERFSIKDEPNYGVIEDLQPKFVKAEVQKRPLGQPHFVEKKNDLREAKAQKVGNKQRVKPVEKPVEKSDKTAYRAPVAAFINQEKVVKRPLSKNVYQKKIEEPKETNDKPVAIIENQDKGSKWGIVIAIILTILLGAAAGTIAFLLLPK